MDAIILCGGKGMRMRPLTEKVPKALVPVDGKTLIDLQLDWLESQGIGRVILACGYKHELLKEHFSESERKIEIIYSVEDEPLGNAGGLKLALNHAKSERVLVCTVDDITNINISELKKIEGNVICVSNLPSPYGIVQINEQSGEVSGFKEKPTLTEYWVWNGVALLEKTIAEELPDSGDLGGEVFPKTILKAYKHKGFWNTANTEKEIKQLEKSIHEKQLQ